MTPLAWLNRLQNDRPHGWRLARVTGMVLASWLLAALPLFERTGPLQWLALAGIVCLSLVCARQLAGGLGAGSSAAAGPDTSTSRPPPPEDAELAALLKSILPVWQQQVALVRSQTEDAITRLVISFSSINDQFEAAGFKGAGLSSNTTAMHSESISLLTLCERELQPVIGSMNKLLDSKTALVNSVQDLSQATGELRNLATAVGQIAAQTNLLSINAAIEAARAGASGRGFGVIAGEIRRLSLVSAQTSRQITEGMAHIGTIMNTAIEAAATATVNDKTTIDLSGSVVRDVLEHVQTLADDAEKMRAQGNIIRTEVENLLVSLQFQDRISQIIGVIDTDIARLNDTLLEDRALADPASWLADLEARYTTNEQRESNPHGADQTAVAAPAQTSVAFF